MVNVLNKQLTEMTGETLYTTQVLGVYPFYALEIYGKSVQNGTPTPETPVDIVSVGDDGAVEVAICGKNLLDPSWFKTYSVTGVNYQNNGDGTFTVSGTATAWAGNASKDFTLFPGTYTISRTAYDSNLNVYIEYKSVKHQGTFTVTEPTVVHMTMQVISGRTVDITFAVQLERSETATVYEPYIGSTATITSGLPLCSVGDVHDELIYNADGTGKIIKRTGVEVVDGQSFLVEHFYTTDDYMIFYVNKPLSCVSTNILTSHFPIVTSSAELKGKESIYMYRVANTDTSTMHLSLKKSKLITPDLDGATAWLAENPVTVVYQLATPQEIELSAAEMAKLQQLETLDGICNIYNSGNGEMYIRAMTADFEYGHEVGFFDSKL